MPRFFLQEPEYELHKTNFNRETLSSPLRQILSEFFMVGSIDDVHVPFVSVSDIMAMALEVVVSQYFEKHKCAKLSCSSIIFFS